MKKNQFMLTVVVALAFNPVLHAQAVEAKQRLNDIEGHWARIPVEQAVESGYVSGYADGSFRPDKLVTRAELLAAVVKAQRLEVRDMDTPFQDDRGWFRPYLAVGLKLSLLKMAEYDSGKFKPNQTMTRGEAARLFVRAAGEEKAGRAKGYVYMSKQLGLLKGNSSGKIGMDRKMTRAEAAVVIRRLLNWQSAQARTVGSLTEQPAYASTGELQQLVVSLESFSGDVMVSGQTVLLNPKGSGKPADYKITLEYDSRKKATTIWLYEKPGLHKQLLMELLVRYVGESADAAYRDAVKLDAGKAGEARLLKTYNGMKIIMDKSEASKSLAIIIYSN
ncbi:S-layer homology domain-containing protein [Paenibacillus algorifonticola]|uniref:S-layer homology domain-containing protein n=1 Tax=Paenibacillus algorifonticola TaxID=684063 RepID=A0A1I2F4B1_9BACL|nr:S-layer homology domain-containing protein [Paenibacillus algorifonticola]SFF00015.1 S-layer homology domain-containing protein [Paenibacillus algorifonticola]